jgi:hypothetical protein
MMSFASAIAILFLFAGSAHAQGGGACDNEPCIFVSNLGTGQVELYDDSGNLINSTFLQGGPGAGGGEGMACTAGNNNVMYVTDNGSSVNAYDVNSGMFLGASFTGGSSLVGMQVNATGSLIYAADDNLGKVFTLAPSGPYLLNLDATTAVSPDVHDVALGTFPAPLAGNVFTSYFPNFDVGINQFVNVGSTSPLSLVTGNALPFATPYANGCAIFNMPTPTQHCWTQVSGMEFDASGNLWANSPTSGDNGAFEFAQISPSTPEFAPVNFVPSTPPGGDLPVGLTIAPLTDPNYPGYILTANFLAGTVSLINPASCTGTVAVPGTCTRAVFFTPGGNPKYVQYNGSCANSNNNGYVEVCKQSNPAFPVTGTFDFTITAPQYSSGPLSVPVGECSGPIQVPSGTVTVTETPTSGDTLSSVSAYSYTASGSYVDQLVAFPAQNPLNSSAAEVATVPGNDVALETIATFTNSSSAGQTGLLKICKIAGTGVAVGTPFSFSTAASGGTKNKYSIEAGPANQGGYCELAGSYAIGTQVKVTETVPKGIFASIAVQPPANGGAVTATSVVAKIGEGVTVVDFTDSTQKPSFTLSSNPSELTAEPGAVATSTITVNPVDGFSGSVKLSATALNNATGKSVGTVSFSPNPTTSSSTMTLTLSKKAETGAATITIKGVSGTETETTTIALTVE